VEFAVRTASEDGVLLAAQSLSSRAASKKYTFSFFGHDLFFSGSGLRHALEVGAGIQLRLWTMTFVANRNARFAQDRRFLVAGE